MTSLPIEGRSRRQSLLSADRSDRIYRTVLTGLSLALPALILVILGVLFVSSLPALRRFGPSFLWTSTWDPVAEVYGAAPMVFGTLASSLLALLIAVPLALGVAVFLTEFSPRLLRQPVAFLVELLAAIPSVVYGLWGIFILIPFLRSYVVPPLKAALAMGATRWEAVRSAVLPYGRAGLIGAVILGLGRALGETMAVTMLIGNRHDIGISILQPAYTMAAAIANEFNEATTTMYRSALFEVALGLFVVTVVVNAIARLLIWRVARGAAVGSRAL